MFDIVISIAYISSQSCRVFFYYGANHSFIIEKHFILLNLSPIILQFGLLIMLLIGGYMIAVFGCVREIKISNRRLEIELIVFLFIKFNIILRMNWLSRFFFVYIDWFKKRETLVVGDENINFQGVRGVISSLILAFQIDKL